MTGRFEVLEHTADVGIRATGDTMEELFQATGEGLATLLGAWFPGEGEGHRVDLAASDPDALLVTWLDELLYLQESRDAVFGGFRLEGFSDDSLRGEVLLAPRGERELEGTGIKAATYHRLRVGREPNGTWTADVYLDV